MTIQTEVEIFQGTPSPPNIDGITVVIDVIRAFTTCHQAFAKCIDSILLVRSSEDALHMKEKDPGLLLAGEINALPIEGFDFGNSPHELKNSDIQGKKLVLKTTNGVEATLNCSNDKKVLVAGFCNAIKTASYIKSLLEEEDYSKVLLVASHPTGDEDLACAEFMAERIRGASEISEKEVGTIIMECHAAKKFFDGIHHDLKPEDILLASEIPDKQFVMQVAYTPRPVISRL